RPRARVAHARVSSPCRACTRCGADFSPPQAASGCEAPPRRIERAREEARRRCEGPPADPQVVDRRPDLIATTLQQQIVTNRKCFTRITPFTFMNTVVRNSRAYADAASKRPTSIIWFNHSQRPH